MDAFTDKGYFRILKIYFGGLAIEKCIVGVNPSDFNDKPILIRYCTFMCQEDK